jgi:hypothetical protein
MMTPVPPSPLDPELDVLPLDPPDDPPEPPLEAVLPPPPLLEDPPWLVLEPPELPDDELDSSPGVRSVLVTGAACEHPDRTARQQQAIIESFIANSRLLAVARKRVRESGPLARHLAARHARAF